MFVFDSSAEEFKTGEACFFSEQSQVAVHVIADSILGLSDVLLDVREDPCVEFEQKFTVFANKPFDSQFILAIRLLFKIDQCAHRVSFVLLSDSLIDILCVV